MNEQIKEIGILQPRKKPFPCHFLISKSLSFLSEKKAYDTHIVTITLNVMETNALPPSSQFVKKKTVKLSVERDETHEFH